jgi:hypothetical protein
MTSDGGPAGGFDYPEDAADAGLPPPVYPGAPPVYPGPPPYPPYQPYPPAKPIGTNGKAVASVVCSLLGALGCCFPLWIAGLILGALAMRETRRTGQDGYGVALTGAILGGLATAAAVLGLLAYLTLLASGWQWI